MPEYSRRADPQPSRSARRRSPAREAMPRKRARLARYNGKPQDPLQALPER